MTITAKYPGKCSVCGRKISAGDSIEWSKSEGSRHVKCANGGAKSTPAAKAPAAPAVAPGPIALSGGSGYGCTGWRVGQVILSSEKRRRAGGPDGLVVVTASSRYVRDDGLSFGVGDDSGHLYSATARPATPAELATAIDDVHGEALAAERQLEVKRVRALLGAGVRLAEAEADHVANVAGDAITIDAGVHGSGREWVLFGDGLIALVSGGYYDDYRRSATVVLRTPEIESRIRALGI